MMITEQFKQAISSAGIKPPHVVINDGQIHRYSTSGRSGDTSGWYVFFEGDVSGGAFGCWRSGLPTQTWTSISKEEFTPEQKREFAKKLDEAKKQQEAKKKQQYTEAAEQAQIIWESATTATDHPYLRDKQIKAHGTRVGRWTKVDQQTGEIYREFHDALLIPIRKGDKLVSLQAIYPTKIDGRNKDFLKGGELRGCYSTIGELTDSKKIYITEGFATGASIHEITGCPVVVCFSASNIKPVAVNIRDNNAGSEIIIAADNDRFTKEPVDNPGVHYANQAAELTKAKVIFPEFEEGSKGTDFNDLFIEYGSSMTVAQLKHDNQIAEVSNKVIDTVSYLPDITSRGKPLSTIENLEEVCKRLGVTLRYNVIKKNDEIIIPGQKFSIDNKDNASLAWLKSWCSRFTMPTGSISEYVCYLSDTNPYNPVANWITSKPWDGKSRMLDFFNSIESTDEALKTILMYRWMISAVAAVFEPNGISAHGVLVLQGEQYLGKTLWLKSLAPPSLDAVQDGVILDLKDKDSRLQALSNWIVELGELEATFKRSDIAQIKAFLTRDKDVLRKPYAIKDSTFARRTVFGASVNPKVFLNDPTGNRRFWTIEVVNINHNHGLDIQQVWAEIYERYKGGESWFLTADEMKALNTSNEDYQATDPIQEKIERKLDWEAPEGTWDYVTATELLEKIGVERATKSDVTNAGQFVRKLNGNRFKRTSTSRLLLVPPMVQ